MSTKRIMGYNKSLSDVYSETWTRYKNQCETDGYIALNRFCAGTGVNVQRLYEWLRRRKISISDYQRSLPDRPDSSREGGEPLFREVKVPGIQVADESRDVGATSVVRDVHIELGCGRGVSLGEISAEGLALLVDVMTRRSDVES